MSGIDGVSGKKTSPWEDDYEKPLPGAAQKAAVNVANAEWLGAPRAAVYEARYPAAIFANPAMMGPAVAFAKPPPPAAPKPEPLAAAPNAWHGVTLANFAENVPTGTRTDASRAFTCGAGYKLYPEVAKQPDGKDAVVYWTAYNAETKRVEFLVGPDALSAFTSAPSDFANAAANGFMGAQDAVTHESVKAVDLAMRKGFAAGVWQAGHASVVAWSNPEWVLKTATNVGSAFVQSATVAESLRLDARALAAEAAVAEPNANGFIQHVSKDLPLGNTAGSRTTNCANAAIATDATIAGSPASALPGEVTDALDVSEHFGTTWSPRMAAPADIEAVMSQAPEGARGIVLGVPENSKIGHFFNVAKQDGVVRFLDGQAGGAATLTPYAKFHLLRTN